MGCGPSKEVAAEQGGPGSAVPVSKSQPKSGGGATKGGQDDGAPKPRERSNSYVAMETREGALRDSPLPPDKAGFHSNHGSKPDYRTGVPKTINQDRGLVSYPLNNDNTQMLIAVYDGHGPRGEQVSEFVCFALVDELEGDKDMQANPGPALARGLTNVDNRLRKEHRALAFEAGTTAIVAVLRRDRIWTACCGDSRCVKGVRQPNGNWKAKDLSIDHKPDLPAERERIESFGGLLDIDQEIGVARVISADGRNGLAMSRSIGDHKFDNVGVLSEAETQEDSMNEDDECLILASDGVWEFISSEEAIQLIFKHRHKGATVACKELIAESARRWRKEEGDYRDDITAVVLFLPLLEILINQEWAQEKMKDKKAGTTVFDTSNAEVTASAADDSLNKSCRGNAEEAPAAASVALGVGDAEEFVPDGPEAGAGAHRSPDHMRPQRGMPGDAGAPESESAKTAKKFERRRLSTSDAMDQLTDEQKQQLGMY